MHGQQLPATAPLHLPCQWLTLSPLWLQGIPNGITGYSAFMDHSVRWCRLAERGHNSRVNGQDTDGTRLWGSNLGGPDVSGLPATPLTQGGVCPDTAAPMWGPDSPPGLAADGPGNSAPHYVSASPVCTSGGAFFAPTQCRVSSGLALLLPDVRSLSALPEQTLPALPVCPYACARLHAL